jgi:hypothetical protein
MCGRLALLSVCYTDSPFAYIVIFVSAAEVLVASSIIVASEGGVARADSSLDVASGQ